jgi:hypothetical protein
MRDSGVDRAPDVAPPTPDAPPDGPAACTPNRPCMLAAGGDGLCRAGACAACQENATDDAACVTAYGTRHVCAGGKCITGDCRTSAACNRGRICGVATPNLCGACATDAQCKADARYGDATICVEGRCVTGNCHNSGDCAGKICNTTTHLCGPCTSDNQCQNDPTHRDTICQIAGGNCVSKTCTNEGGACAPNPADVCCSGSCVPGDCCTGGSQNMCPADKQTCLANKCTNTQCDAVGGDRTYFVDPVNGRDDTGTGSGKLSGAADPACSFKTLTKALTTVTLTPSALTTIVLVGRGGATTALVGESLPFQVGSKIRITTMGGPLSLDIPASTIGFRFVGDGSSLAPIDAASLTISGSGDTSGSALQFLVTGGAASVQNVTITDTGADSIQVTSGTANIGGGMLVTKAGNASNPASGLDVAGGTANIEVAAGGRPTVFDTNNDFGIDVHDGGVLIISGTPGSTPGEGTVVLRGNTTANLSFRQTPGAVATTSSISGLVSFASRGDGIRIAGGSNVKLRRSVVLANLDNGLEISAADATEAGGDLTKIDLGVETDFGLNVLGSAAQGNAHAAICLTLPPATPLHAQGNTFSNKNCSQQNPGAIAIQTGCGSATDVGAVSGTPGAMIDVARCLIGSAP